MVVAHKFTGKARIEPRPLKATLVKVLVVMCGAASGRKAATTLQGNTRAIFRSPDKVTIDWASVSEPVEAMRIHQRIPETNRR